MKRIILIINIILMSVNISAQNLPISNANTTKTGIVYSYGETDESLAISISYKSSHKKKILDIISNNFSEFINQKYINNNEHFYETITVEKDYSLKIELRTKNELSPTYKEIFEKEKDKIKNVYKEIIAL